MTIAAIISGDFCGVFEHDSRVFRCQCHRHLPVAIIPNAKPDPAQDESDHEYKWAAIALHILSIRSTDAEKEGI